MIKKLSKQKLQRFKQLIAKERKQIAVRKRNEKIMWISIVLGIIFAICYLLKRTTTGRKDIINQDLFN